MNADGACNVASMYEAVEVHPSRRQTAKVIIPVSPASRKAQKIVAKYFCEINYCRSSGFCTILLREDSLKAPTGFAGAVHLGIGCEGGKRAATVECFRRRSGF